MCVVDLVLAELVLMLPVLSLYSCCAVILLQCEADASALKLHCPQLPLSVPSPQDTSGFGEVLSTFEHFLHFG